MYNRILVALDHTPADDTLVPHVTELARLTGGDLVLAHVATGWVSHWGDQLNIDNTEEVREDQAYLDRTADRLRSEGFNVTARLLLGDPARELLRFSRAEKCDLIAMTTHGHRFIYDLLIGSTIDKVRHASDIPLLVVRSSSGNRGS